ncbi:MAG: hypothetical protein KDA85_21545, partial [Planctomycetaceae bacterium]|nr:hypothetical protein [Planctomycetaceae bacterium]
NLPTLAAPSLNHLAAASSTAALAGRIRVPQSQLPNPRMPQLGLTEKQSLLIAQYLLAKSQPVADDQTLKFKDDDVAAGQLLLASVGCVACHQAEQVIQRSPSDTKPNVEQVVASFVADYAYRGPDLDSVGGRRSPVWLDRWLRDPASLNTSHRMPVFSLSTDERRQIVAALTDVPPAAAINRQESDGKPSADALAEGKRLIEHFGCASCHQVPGVTAQAMPIPGLAALRDADSDRTLSCLTKANAVGVDRQSRSGRPVPLFEMSEVERAALAAAVRQHQQLELSGGVAVQRSLVLQRNGCLQCHDRNTSLGLSAHAATIERWLPELQGQSQGLIPPSLTAVGDKLTDDYLTRAVAGEQKNRRLPWLSVRMPRFSHPEKVRGALVDSLVRTDRIPAAADPLREDILQLVNDQQAASPIDLLEGNQLTGAAGFNCVACHQAGPFEPRNVALGTRGSDLMSMGQRIRSPYFFRWMKNPIRVVRGIEMPAIRKAIPGVRGESIPEQLAVIWRAVRDPRFTPPTITSRYEQIVNVTPGSAPRIVRDVFTIGSGKAQSSVARAFAVGFDNGHSLLLDLDSLQLREWVIGEFARQRTEGKSWFWDLAGTAVYSGISESPVFQLVRDRDDVAFPPVADESRIAELLSYQDTADGVTARIRLYFDTTGALQNTPPPDPDPGSPHFVTPIWQDRQLETVELLLQFTPIRIGNIAADLA